MRVRSSAQFRQGDSITLHGDAAKGAALVVFATRWLDTGLNLPIPGDLLAEVSGPARDMQEAMDRYVNGALRFMSTLAVSANAAIDPIEFELAFDIDPGVSDHELRQNVMLPPDQDLTKRTRRTIDAGATTAMIKCLLEHPDRDRLWRAIDHYALALADWRLGHEIVALEHLVVGIEALTQVTIRNYTRTTGQSERDLQSLLGIRSPDSSTEMCPKCAARLRGQTQYEFYSAVRRERLFNGDVATFKRAKEVSDGAEHGYSAFEEMYADAKQAALPTATYLRTAILNLLELDDDLKRVLLDDRYAEPIGPWPNPKYVSGIIRSAAGELARKGEPYPYLKVEKQTKRVEITEDGRSRVHYGMKFSPVLADGASFIAAPRPGTD